MKEFLDDFAPLDTPTPTEIPTPVPTMTFVQFATNGNENALPAIIILVVTNVASFVIGYSSKS